MGKGGVQEMRFKVITILALLCVGMGAFSVSALADGRDPAACLLFPYFNTNKGNLAVISITNTGPDPVDVRLVWVDEVICSPEDQWITLTGYDTFSFLDQAMNPQGERGFMYCYVVQGFGIKDEVTDPLKSNVLIGQELIFGNWPTADPKNAVVNFGINAVSFEAIGPNGDDKVKLDGTDYDLAPKTIYFPRFFGQMTNFASAVILINLTGGKFFTHCADVMVFNDNEVGFSTTVEFPCFYFTTLINLSGATTETWLLNSNHDLEELWDGKLSGGVNNAHKKTGWIYITGDYAYASPTQYIDYASLYAVLVEQIGGQFGADLPWELFDGVNYVNGMLWSTKVNGQ
jgi:hypothetical protein